MKMLVLSPPQRHAGCVAVVLLAAAGILAAAGNVGRSFVWNLSPSLPRGLYLLHRSTGPARGAIVTFPPPDRAASTIAARGYLPAGAWLLKTVVALPGDVVCIDTLTFKVNGRIIGGIARRDSAGRPLDPFLFCGLLRPDSAFVATTSPLSYDSRYFGPVPLSTLTVAVPAWTY
jgi:conjugative transfer signal peptidase TraF